MKDYLRAHKFRNVFPNNPTQTMYFRFQKNPSLKLETAFTKSDRAFKNASHILETSYIKSMKKLQEELNA
jgi:hypothetical protein